MAIRGRGASAAPLPALESSAGMEMMRIPAGSFMMGSPASETGRYSSEVRHRVTLTRDFLLASTAVTQGQRRAVMGTNPSRFKGDDLPVEQVSWYDAVEFCNGLSAREGLTPAYRISGKSVDWARSADGYRLPTESEWEYSCRAGTSTRFWSGDSDSDLGRVGWFGSNSGGETRPVGGKPSNAWGLYDVHGNVWEWCWDWHGDYPSGSVTDPAGPSSGADRVLRGGSWDSSLARSCRSANRNHDDPGLRYYTLGLRPARSTP